MPDRSGLPSAVRGAGADRFGLPSGVRGMPGVFIVSHCAAKGADSKNAKVVTAAAAGNSLAFIQSLLLRDYIASFRVAIPLTFVVFSSNSPWTAANIVTTAAAENSGIHFDLGCCI